MKNKVGAGILNAITESLYDNPIVVFREYVQNSVDAFKHQQGKTSLPQVRIFHKSKGCSNSILFLDNGSGIPEEQFEDKMTQIGASFKLQTEDVGYKGIGRLSGISYCDALYFVNILDFHQERFQIYGINCIKYRTLKKQQNLSEMDFAELMDSIGKTYNEQEISTFLKSEDWNAFSTQNKDMYNANQSGFLVVMKNISNLLMEVVTGENFLDNLGWLLPVDFSNDIFANEQCSDALEYIRQTIPESVKTYSITFNENVILRPIKEISLRQYSIVKNLDYGFAFINFSNSRMVIDKKNNFSGLKVYLDNFLLCNEDELIPSLARYKFLKSSSTNEMIQSCRAIGGIIYISSKSMIFANARRTFIEVYDSESLDFLQKVGSCIEEINSTRYALSRLHSEAKKVDQNQAKLTTLLERANKKISALANFDCNVESEISNSKQDFENLSSEEQCKFLKKKISIALGKYITEFVEQYTCSDYQNAVDDFIIWLKNK